MKEVVIVESERVERQYYQEKIHMWNRSGKSIVKDEV